MVDDGTGQAGNDGAVHGAGVPPKTWVASGNLGRDFKSGVLTSELQCCDDDDCRVLVSQRDFVIRQPNRQRFFFFLSESITPRAGAKAE